MIVTQGPFLILFLKTICMYLCSKLSWWSVCINNAVIEKRLSPRFPNTIKFVLVSAIRAVWVPSDSLTMDYGLSHNPVPGRSCNAQLPTRLGLGWFIIQIATLHGMLAIRGPTRSGWGSYGWLVEEFSDNGGNPFVDMTWYVVNFMEINGIDFKITITKPYIF